MGVLDKKIPLDLEVEHSNKYVKQGIRNLDVHVTEPAVTIARTERWVRGVVDNVNRSLHHAICSDKPTNLSTAYLDERFQEQICANVSE